VLEVKKSKQKPRGPKKTVPGAIPATPGQGEYRLMTVALIRDPESLEAVEVAFSESARFYRLLRINPDFEKILAVLREAKKKNRPVLVMMRPPQTNFIEDVKPSGWVIVAS